MFVGSGQWLLFFQRTHEREDLLAQSLVLLQHLVQVLFEVAKLNLVGMQPLVARLHYADDLGKVLLRGRRILSRGVGGYGTLADGGKQSVVFVHKGT